MTTSLASRLPGTLTDTGLELPEGLPFEEWQRTLALLGRMDRGVKWGIIDCYLYGERTYGEPAAQFAESIGWSPQTLLNALSVARTFPPARRHAALSFGHHDAVVALSQGEQVVLLERAATLGWSVGMLRAQVRERRGEGRPVPLVEVADDLASAVHFYVQGYRDALRRPGVDPPELSGLEAALTAWYARRNPRTLPPAG